MLKNTSFNNKLHIESHMQRANQMEVDQCMEIDIYYIDNRDDIAS